MHLHDDAGCGVANALAGVRGGAAPGAGHDQRLRRAHRQLQPHHDHPEPHAEDGRAHDPRGPARAAHAVSPPHRRAGEHAAQPAAPYVGASAFAHKAGLHVSAIVRRPDAYEHVDPDAVGNGTRFVVSRAGRQVDARAQGRGARPRPRRRRAQRGRRHAEAPRARGLPLRGGRRLARAADARAPRAGSRTFFELESFRVITDERGDRRVHHRGHGQGARRRRARRRAPPRATARSTRSTTRCATPSAPRYPELGQRAPHRLQGAGARHRQGHRRGHPGAASTRPTASARGRRSACRENIIEASWQALVRLDRLRPAARLTAPTGGGVASAPWLRPTTCPCCREDRAPRRAEPLPPARPWRADRPGDSWCRRRTAGRPHARPPGSRPGLRADAGPLFDDRLELRAGESKHDVVAGCLGVAMRRAAVRPGAGHPRSRAGVHAVRVPRGRAGRSRRVPQAAVQRSGARLPPAAGRCRRGDGDDVSSQARRSVPRWRELLHV